MTDFGPWISMAREVQGISRLDLAERARISVKEARNEPDLH